MGGQQVGSGGIDPKVVHGPYDESLKQLGDLVVGIRIDAVPSNEGNRLAAQGRFYPLTLDKSGNLRVTMAESEGVTDQLLVLREVRDLMAEVRDLLLKIA